jgi:hypothetical protein
VLIKRCEPGVRLHHDGCAAPFDKTADFGPKFSHTDRASRAVPCQPTIIQALLGS